MCLLSQSRLIDEFYSAMMAHPTTIENPVRRKQRVKCHLVFDYDGCSDMALQHFDRWYYRWTSKTALDHFNQLLPLSKYTVGNTLSPIAHYNFVKFHKTIKEKHIKKLDLLKLSKQIFEQFLEDTTNKCDVSANDVVVHCGSARVNDEIDMKAARVFFPWVSQKGQVQRGYLASEVISHYAAEKGWRYDPRRLSDGIAGKSARHWPQEQEKLDIIHHKMKLVCDEEPDSQHRFYFFDDDANDHFFPHIRQHAQLPSNAMLSLVKYSWFDIAFNDHPLILTPDTIDPHGILTPVNTETQGPAPICYSSFFTNDDAHNATSIATTQGDSTNHSFPPKKTFSHVSQTHVI